MKKVLISIMAVMVVLAMTACGGSSGSDSSSQDTSKTAAVFENITEDSGIHMNIEMTVSKKNVKVDTQMKGDKMYAKATVDKQKVIAIDDGDNFYTLLPDTKIGYKSDDDTLGLEDSLDQLSDIADEVKDAKFTEGTKEINGKTYDTEEYKEDDGHAVFCYEGDKLCYIISKTDDAEETIKVNALDNKVDESLFKVPSGYTITKQTNSDETDDND